MSPIHWAMRRRLAYDALGRLVSTTDASGRTTGVAHDASGHVVKATLPDGRAVGRTFDADGVPLTFKDSGNHTWQWTLDAAGRPVGVIDPLAAPRRPTSTRSGA